MEPMQMAVLTALPHARAHEAHSALPDAPVVAHVERQAVIRSGRLAAARALGRLADAIAPTPSPTT